MSNDRDSFFFYHNGTMAEQSSDELLTGAPVAEADSGEEETKPERLNLEIRMQSPSACQRHVTVSVSRDDIDRYFDKAFADMMPTASVPGFRAGRAPRKLVEHRYRKDLADQVKGSLLMDSMAQVTEDSKLAAISEPDFDPVAVKIPDEGPMTFEFDIEVRPEFDLPNWRGLKVERPTKQFGDKDVEARIEELLAKYGRLVPFDGAASSGDYIVCNLAFKHDGELISESKEEVIRIRPALSFRDGRIENFDKVMQGVKAEETRTAEAKLTNDAPNVNLRGKSVTAEFEVLEVKKLKLPELTPDFLSDMGFESEEAMRKGVLADLERKLSYYQQQRARQQVTALLTESANWDLPPDLLRRQARRELERAVMELRSAGFSDSEIRAHENELRQNSAVSTARALKEHFILERIAEDEKIDAEGDDYDAEIQLIAMQTDESPRRIRSRLEKGGMMDSLRNQIVERKVIAKVLEAATFKDVPFEPAAVDAEAIDKAAGGEERDVEIPEAKFADVASSVPGAPATSTAKD
jgi:trigger factor